jgi:hypothetical protein
VASKSQTERLRRLPMSWEKERVCDVLSLISPAVRGITFLL